MRLGVHLPLADLGDGVPTADDLRDYVAAARELGFSTVAANDHLVWSHPWLDGTTALASVAGSAGEHGPGHEHHAARRTPSRGRGQDPDHAGSPGRWACRRRPRPRVQPARLRGCRHPVRGALVAVRRGPAARALPGPRESRPRAGRSTRATTTWRRHPTPAGDLVRELGVRPSTRCDGCHGRRLVRLGVQRDSERSTPKRAARLDAHLQAGRVGRRTPSPMRSPPPGCTSPRASEEAEHVLVDILAPTLEPGPRGAEAPADRQRAATAPKHSPPTPKPARTRSSSGRCATRSASSSCAPSVRPSPADAGRLGADVSCSWSLSCA